MSASNHNYVCFECRTAIRHPKTAPKAPMCLGCGAVCFNLGYKVEIPKHDDLKSWRALRVECEKRVVAHRDDLVVSGVRSQHFMEREMERMRQMPANRERERQIKKLEEQLAEHHKKKTGEQFSDGNPH